MKAESSCCFAETVLSLSVEQSKRVWVLLWEVGDLGLDVTVMGRTHLSSQMASVGRH